MIRELTPKQWFDQAKLTYVTNHQGCAWCAGSHCVTRYNNENVETYYCQTCDFQVHINKATGEYESVPGVMDQDSMLDRVFDFSVDDQNHLHDD